MTIKHHSKRTREVRRIRAALAGADLLECLSHWQIEQHQMPKPKRVEEMVSAIRVLATAIKLTLAGGPN